ncbi:MAG: hypothetical protein HYS34_05215 [Acidobacteria bacterium]|nr:hypothetical protein [Acidobacteriota bacterium]
MIPAGARDHKIEPEYLGPLADRPLAETAGSGGPADLFPGASAFLSARHQRRRQVQWKAAGPLLDRLLRPEEHVLYVAHATEVPPVLHAMAMGYMALAYHQVVLVFTETRLIEVLLDERGKSAGTRLRSYPWASVRDLKLGFGKLSLVPAEGRKQNWRVPVRGDKKLLNLLLPRLKPRLMQEGEASARKVPLWHCPQCGAMVPERPRSCDACRTTFRSSRLAAMLSLAFPGAGLLYAGHPFLAAADFFGEVVLYAVFLMMLLQAGPGGVAVAVGFGAFLFLLTKFESVHLSQILVARSKPETEARRSGFSRLALIGGLVSVLLVGGVLPLAGTARPVVDRDLDIGGQGSPWRGSRKTGEWEIFADDASARSQWWHSSGHRVTLFAYPQGMLEDARQFRTEFRRGLGQQGMRVVKDDADVPAPFRGFRFVGVVTNKSGAPVTVVHYFIADEENRDLHHALAAAVEEEGDQAEQVVRDFLSHARWIATTPPERTASGPDAAR